MPTYDEQHPLYSAILAARPLVLASNVAARRSGPVSRARAKLALAADDTLAAGYAVTYVDLRLSETRRQIADGRRESVLLDALLSGLVFSDSEHALACRRFPHTLAELARLGMTVTR